MGRYRILALEGGPSGPTYCRLLRELEEKRPGVLASADMIAGTSGGAILGSYYAMHKKADRNVEIARKAVKFNEDLFLAFQPRKRDQVRMALGVQSAIDGTKVFKLLQDTYGADLTLGDLNTDVAFVSFRMSRPWGPKVFDNAPGDPDCALNVANVAFQSGAFPALVPIWEGHVDGGVFANNPAMCGLAQALAYRERTKIRGPEDVVILSLGGDTAGFGGRFIERMYQNERLPWGWLPWLVQPTMPILMLELMINAGDRGTSFQARQLIGDNFFRLAIPSVSVVEGLLELLLARHSQDVFDKAEDLATRWGAGAPMSRPGVEDWPSLEDTIQWVDRYWLD